MYKIKLKVMFLAVIVVLLSSAATILWTFGNYKKYVENNPPITIPSAAECSAAGLVAQWKLDDVTDDRTSDSSWQEMVGRYKYWFDDVMNFMYGRPKLSQGVVADGIRFDRRQWISGGNNNCFTVDKFTIAVWVWQESDYMQTSSNIAPHPWPYNVPTIMAKGSWPYDGWWLCSTTADDEGKIRHRDIDIGIAWGNGFTHVKSGYQLPLREWHHVVVSMDNSRHEVQFYIDGIFKSKQINVPNWIVNWNHDLFVGEYDGSGRWPWHGKLGDARFYNKVLNGKEVQAIYSQHI